jgi:hypothetical protein
LLAVRGVDARYGSRVRHRLLALGLTEVSAEGLSRPLPIRDLATPILVSARGRRPRAQPG